MAIDYTWLLEQIDSNSPGDIEVAPGSTSATLFFIIKRDSIYKAMIDILGYARISNKQWAAGGGIEGGLLRQNEMSHPRAPWLYAESVELVGIKAAGNTAASSWAYPAEIFQTNNPNPRIPIDYRTIPYVDVYDHYRIQVKFTSRNYFLLTDEQLEVPIKDGNAIPLSYAYYERVNQVPQVAFYRDFREYLRNCEVFVEPGNELIVSGTGKAYWNSTQPGVVNKPVGGPEINAPINTEQAPTNFINITKNKIKIKWYKVPKIVSYNPQYQKYVGMINYGPNFFQDIGDVKTFNYEFFNFAPGTLLFTGIQIEENNSSYPVFRYSGDTSEDLINNYMRNVYVNITFNFDQFVIPDDQIMYPALANIQNATFGKMITSWNMVPTPNRKFYYIESNTIFEKQNAFPPYEAYPFQRLWDPKAT